MRIDKVLARSSARARTRNLGKGSAIDKSRMQFYVLRTYANTIALVRRIHSRREVPSTGRTRPLGFARNSDSQLNRDIRRRWFPRCRENRKRSRLRNPLGFYFQHYAMHKIRFVFFYLKIKRRGFPFKLSSFLSSGLHIDRSRLDRSYLVVAVARSPRDFFKKLKETIWMER